MDFRANLLKARELTSGLSRVDFNRRPDPGHWSIAEHLQHLVTANRLDIEPIRQAIDTGRARGQFAYTPFLYGWLSRKFIASIEPPVTRKFRAPSAYRPPSAESDIEPTLAAYERITSTFGDLWRSAEGLDLARIKTVMPALPPALRSLLKMPLGARFELLAAHDRRHLWHIEQLRKSMI